MKCKGNRGSDLGAPRMDLQIYIEPIPKWLERHAPGLTEWVCGCVVRLGTTRATSSQLVPYRRVSSTDHETLYILGSLSHLYGKAGSRDPKRGLADLIPRLLAFLHSLLPPTCSGHGPYSMAQSIRPEWQQWRDECVGQRSECLMQAGRQGVCKTRHSGVEDLEYSEGPYRLLVHQSP